MSVTADCGMVTVLCKSSYDVDDHPLNDVAATTVVDLVANDIAQNNGNNVWAATNTDAERTPAEEGGSWNEEHPGRNSTMWLLEWISGAAGQTSSPPTNAVKINHAIGGWNYGNWYVYVCLCSNHFRFMSSDRGCLHRIRFMVCFRWRRADNTPSSILSDVTRSCADVRAFLIRVTVT